jgi:hypothetical protein
VVLAPAFEVVGKRGTSRVLLLVSCPWCARLHQHTAPTGFGSGRRLAACRAGRYVVHALPDGDT